MEQGDVAAALKELWKDAQLQGKSVRVGIAPSRAIVRTIEVPDLPVAELRAMIGYELSDYVPLNPSETTFGIMPLDQFESGNGKRRRVLLAAAPLSAVNAMVETIKQAGLKVEAVDVGPLALSRAFRPTAMLRADGTSAPSVDAIISIGGETLLATVAEAGNLLFNRKAPSQAGTQLTMRIHEQLSITPELAEMAKRRIITNDSRHLLASVNTMTMSVIDEVAEEIQESIDYYVSQLNSRPIDRILLTGGGALLPGLDRAIAERTGYPTFFGDPFQDFNFDVPGLELEDCAFVSSFVASAIGYALGGAEGAVTMDLRQQEQRQKVGNKKVFAIAFGVVSVVGLGYTYLGAREELDSVNFDNSAIVAESQTVTQQVNDLRTQALTVGTLSKAQMRGIVDDAYGRRIDWTNSYSALDALSATLGISIKSFTGATSLADAPVAADAAAPASDGPALIGRVSFEGSAPDLPAISAWSRLVEGDDRFAGVSTPLSTQALDADLNPIGYTFSAELFLTDAALIPKPADAVPAQGAAAGDAPAQPTPEPQP